MNKDKFHAFLDETTHWKLGIELNTQGRSNDENLDISNNPYPIVKKVKEVAKPCEWCNNTCTKPKIFKKQKRTGFWYAKCQDCKEIRDFDPDIF